MTKRLSLRVVLLLAAALIVARALPYLLFPQLAFDSDQAIVGLMAKHLVEGRAFPLFFYGQTYMLAVEAWTAAPLFFLAGPGVTTLRLTILGWNIAFAVLLIAALHKECGLTPFEGLLAAAPFAVVPPSIATLLMTAQGGIVEPFVYIIVLWLIRRRPLWFGGLLAIGFRNREFTFYAVPALLVIEVTTGEFTAERCREWLAAAVTFVLCWEAIEALKPYADLSGPGTRGQLVSGFTGSQFENLLQRSDFDPAAIVGRAARLIPSIARWFAGGDAELPATHPSMMLACGAVAFAFGAVRLAMLAPRLRARVAALKLPFYLMAVGAIAVLAFIASKPVLEGYSRYALLGLLLPTGVAAAVFAAEDRLNVRRIFSALVAAWALASLADNSAVAAHFIRQPPVNEPRMIAQRLTSQGISNARSDYWHAYVVTFVSNERVRVSSPEFPRITQYEIEADRAEGRLPTISEQPCAGGSAVASVYICRP